MIVICDRKIVKKILEILINVFGFTKVLSCFINVKIFIY